MKKSCCPPKNLKDRTKLKKTVVALKIKKKAENHFVASVRKKLAPPPTTQRTPKKKHFKKCLFLFLK